MMLQLLGGKKPTLTMRRIVSPAGKTCLATGLRMGVDEA